MLMEEPAYQFRWGETREEKLLEIVLTLLLDLCNLDLFVVVYLLEPSLALSLSTHGQRRKKETLAVPSARTLCSS